VTEWDPPKRLAFTWSPGGGPVTSIGVDFEDSEGQTRVVLTHAGWEAYGDKAPERRAGYDGDYIEHHGDPVADGEMTVAELLTAEVHTTSRRTSVR